MHYSEVQDKCLWRKDLQKALSHWLCSEELLNYSYSSPKRFPGCLYIHVTWGHPLCFKYISSSSDFRCIHYIQPPQTEEGLRDTASLQLPVANLHLLYLLPIGNFRYFSGHHNHGTHILLWKGFCPSFRACRKRTQWLTQHHRRKLPESLKQHLRFRIVPQMLCNMNEENK